MKDSKIEWTDHTWNPWIGCSRVSSGCANCYAERDSHRNPKVLGEWGPDARRAHAAEGYWNQPYRWDAKAKKEGVRRRVFCGSLMDIFENREDLLAPRHRLFEIIGACQQLDWLLLTKRPEHVARLIELATGFGYAADWLRANPHVWLGVTAENQERANERLPVVLAFPANVHWVSVEPQIGPVVLELAVRAGRPWDGGESIAGPGPNGQLGHIDWVIVGSESGQGRRPFDLAWARTLIYQCRRAKVPVFVKQLPADAVGVTGKNGISSNPGEWPEDLRVQEVPFA